MESEAGKQDATRDHRSGAKMDSHNRIGFHKLGNHPNLVFLMSLLSVQLLMLVKAQFLRHMARLVTQTTKLITRLKWNKTIRNLKKT